MEKPRPKEYYDYQQCKSFMMSKYNIKESAFRSLLQSSDCGQDAIILICRDFYTRNEEVSSLVDKMCTEFGNEFEMKIWW